MKKLSVYQSAQVSGGEFPFSDDHSSEIATPSDEIRDNPHSEEGGVPAPDLWQNFYGTLIS